MPWVAAVLVPHPAIRAQPGDKRSEECAGTASRLDGDEPSEITIARVADEVQDQLDNPGPGKNFPVLTSSVDTASSWVGQDGWCVQQRELIVQLGYLGARLQCHARHGIALPRQ